ncbi:MAG: Maf-like protein [Clostridium sp.]|nr:Maf-like protein [Clostridium sp.]MDY3827175.1 Maf-like protein [Clostridium sp.]
MKIILNSASIRRKELLARIVDDFLVRVSEFDENSVSFKGNVSNYVAEIALGKAKSAILEASYDDIIISADTVVSINDKILGKPKDEKEAYEMLKLLSGNMHRVYTGIAVINMKTGKILNDSEMTEVYFSDIDDEEIFEYIKSKEPMDKAGAYGIQGKGGVFINKINGCYYNVVGLPLNKLNNMLKKIVNN